MKKSPSTIRAAIRKDLDEFLGQGPGQGALRPCPRGRERRYVSNSRTIPATGTTKTATM